MPRCKGFGWREGECYNVAMDNDELCPVCRAIARSEAMDGIDRMRKADRESTRREIRRIRKAVEQ